MTSSPITLSACSLVPGDVIQAGGLPVTVETVNRTGDPTLLAVVVNDGGEMTYAYLRTYQDVTVLAPAGARTVDEALHAATGGWVEHPVFAALSPAAKAALACTISA